MGSLQCTRKFPATIPTNPKPNLNERWIQAIRRNAKTTQSWACSLCPERTIFTSSQTLWDHAQTDHAHRLPSGEDDLKYFRAEFEAESRQKTTKVAEKGNSLRKPNPNEANRAQPEPPPPSKLPLSFPTRLATARSISGLGVLNLGVTGDNIDVDMREVSDGASHTHPRKRVALGDGISAGSASPFRDSSPSPPPRRLKSRSLGTEQDATLARSSLDPSGIVSTQASRAKRCLQQSIAPTSCRNTSKAKTTSKQHPSRNYNVEKSPPSQNLFSSAADESYDIILQPETRPISQEQLVAEVKGIYAGLVMVEAKCIEVDNKQASLAHSDANQGSQPKLNNEQWQAFIALHRTLLHEHHDFFLASQHPSASRALRKLASTYAMPARMWRHGIHSSLELLRHRLPSSLDHMMALLYETVPAFQDTWIECLGDLGRYRMAIEDDDIRDREVWTGVARHWYSKASDKPPHTGRLFHHLAILAGPNPFQQLFYYAKSLCVAVPFPLDMAFVKAHGLLFTNRTLDKFEQTKIDFLGLLDKQIGRVTRKFMEQRYHITVENLAKKAFDYTADILSLQSKSPWRTEFPKAQWQQLPSRTRRIFWRYQKNFAMILLLNRIQFASALPTGDPSIEEVPPITNPIQLALMLSIILASILYCKTRKDTGQLLILAILVNCGSFIVGNDKKVSKAELVGLWLYAATLTMLLLKKSLQTHSRFGGMVALAIAILSLLAAYCVANGFSFPEDENYSNGFVLATMTMLPTSLFLETMWLAYDQLRYSGVSVHVVEEARISARGEQPRVLARGGSFQMDQLDAPRDNDYRYQYLNTL